MTRNILAIFKNGILRPLQPLVGVANNTEVDGTVRARDNNAAARVPGEPEGVKECVGTISKADAEERGRALPMSLAKNPASDAGFLNCFQFSNRFTAAATHGLCGASGP